MITKVVIDAPLLYDVCGKLVDYHNSIARASLADEEKYKYHLNRALHYLRFRLFLLGKIYGVS